MGRITETFWEISKPPSVSWISWGPAKKPTENAGVSSTDMRVGLFLTGDSYLGKLNGEHLMIYDG